MTNLNAAEMYAVLEAMTRDLPDRTEIRSQEQVDHDMLLEQRAEDRKWARSVPTSDRDAEWLAERNERRWSA